MRRSSSQMHRFIRKLGYKQKERLHFILVNDARQSNYNSGAFSNRRQAMRLHKPLYLVEKRVPKITLISKSNKSVHLLTQNTRGYAVFMQINYREAAEGEFNDIRAQFIDVDLNKISERYSTKEQVRQRIQSFQSNPVDRLLAITVKREESGHYLLTAHRTAKKTAQLKREYIKKQWKRIKHAMIIETKNGFHIYWVIKGGAINKFEPIQKALARKFGSDPKITNLSRVMRIPGFYHMKNPESPFLVRVRRWGRKKPFTQKEVIRKYSLKPL